MKMYDRSYGLRRSGSQRCSSSLAKPLGSQPAHTFHPAKRRPTAQAHRPLRRQDRQRLRSRFGQIACPNVLRRWWPTVLLSLCLLLAATSRSVGQHASDQGPIDPMTEPLITDRPDFTESTETVPAGHVQLEAGYTFTFDREGADRTRDHAAPELLLRIGLVENLELRIGWEGYSWTESQFEVETRPGRRATREEWTQGAHDLSLGFKHKLIEQEGWIPHFGILGAITVPSGSSGFSSGDVDPELVLLWAYDVTDSLAIAGNVGLAVPTENGSRFFQTSASLSIAISVTERLGAYAEYFGFYPNTESTDAAHSINGGLTYLLSNDFQIDVRLGAGVNEEADDFFTGVGFAWRL